MESWEWGINQALGGQLAAFFNLPKDLRAFAGRITRRNCKFSP